MKRTFRFLLMGCLLIGLLGQAVPALAASSEVEKLDALAPFLNADGTLRLDGTAQGTLDISNYNVRLDPQLGPVFAAAGSMPDASAQSISTYGNWSALGEGGGIVDDQVYGIAVDDTKVYIVGSFTDLGNNPAADFVATWDGTNWSALGSDGSGNGSIQSYTYAVGVDTIHHWVYVGGSFTRVSDNGTDLPDAQFIAMWDGANWHALGSGGIAALNDDVLAIAVSGANVYVGGLFSDVHNGATDVPQAAYLAKWSGGSWHSLGSDGGTGSALGNYVTALAVRSGAGGDQVYAAGNFTDVQDGTNTLDTADHVAMWDGTHWNAFGDDGSGDGAFHSISSINALAVDDSGHLYVGGQFGQLYGPNESHTGSATIPGTEFLAEWNGSAWVPVGGDNSGNSSVGDYVGSLLVVGSDLYVGGSFINVKDGNTIIAEADFVAKWDGTNWSAIGSDGSGNGSIPAKPWAYVRTLAMVGSHLLIGGGFYDLNDGGTVLPQADFLAQWNGTHWSSLGTDANGALVNGYLSSSVTAIAVDGSKVYVGGRFVDVSNHGSNIPEADTVAMWDGSDWHALGDDGSGSGSLQGWVYALAVDPASGNLYVGGDFTHVNNHGNDLKAAEYIAMWDGSNWHALGDNGVSDPNLGQGSLDPSGAKGGSVSAIAIVGTDIYVGGNFQDVTNGLVGIPAADFIAKWNGSSWSSVGQGQGGNGALDDGVSSIAASGSGLYVGGWFTGVHNGETSLPEAQYVAKWDGVNWSALGSDGAGGPALGGATPTETLGVDAVAVNGSDVYVGGSFRKVYDGTTTELPGVQFLAKWDGSHWSGFGPGAIDSRVFAITVDGTNLYVGGYFTDVIDNGTTLPEADHVARWDGTHWHPLGSGGGLQDNQSGGGSVEALVLSGTDLFVGGQFSNAKNGTTVLKAADYVAVIGVDRTTVIPSVAAQDGYVVEAGELTGLGGVVNSKAQTLRIGDDGLRDQYRSILSFPTAAVLPPGVSICGAKLVLTQQAIKGKGNPMSTLKGLIVDVKKGFFGKKAALESADFQTKATASTLPLQYALTNGTYTIDLSSKASSFNKSTTTGGGLTQMRLRFKLDDNNNASANYLSLYSGNAPVASQIIAPQLSITYCVP